MVFSISWLLSFLSSNVCGHTGMWRTYRNCIMASSARCLNRFWKRIC